METEITIGRFREEEAEELAALIAKVLRTTNSRDYSEEYLEALIPKMSPEALRRRGRETHLYVARRGEQLIGSGAIGPYEGRREESCFYTVFVLPEYQGRGVGKKIIGALERDEYFLRAKRIEVPASLTACGFYRKLGYEYKNGVREPDAELLIRLEKFRSPNRQEA